jgi:hypothetical protein
MKTGKALSVITVLLIITVCTLTSFTGKNSKQELSVYHYYNFEDTDRGSLVIVLATDLEMAEFMIKNELYELGLTFEPSNILDIVPVNHVPNFVIYSDPGNI